MLISGYKYQAIAKNLAFQFVLSKRPRCGKESQEAMVVKLEFEVSSSGNPGMGSRGERK